MLNEHLGKCVMRAVAWIQLAQDRIEWAVPREDSYEISLLNKMLGISLPFELVLRFHRYDFVSLRSRFSPRAPTPRHFQFFIYF